MLRDPSEEEEREARWMQDIYQRFDVVLRGDDWRLLDPSTGVKRFQQTYDLLEQHAALQRRSADHIEVGDLLIEACLLGNFIVVAYILHTGAPIHHRNGEALQVSVAVLSNVYHDHTDYVLRMIGSARLTRYLLDLDRARLLMQQVMVDPTLQSLRCVLELDQREDRGNSQSYYMALMHAAREDTEESVQRLRMLLDNVPFPAAKIADIFFLINREYLSPLPEDLSLLKARDVLEDEVLSIFSLLFSKVAELDAIMAMRMYAAIVEHGELTYYSAVSILSKELMSQDPDILEEEVLRAARRPEYNAFLGEAVRDTAIISRGERLSADAFARIVDKSYQSNPELFSQTFPFPSEVNRQPAWLAHAFLIDLEYEGGMTADERDALKQRVLTPEERADNRFI